MMKFSEIYEGWKNDLFPSKELKNIIARVSEERLDICRNCDAYSEEGIGCTVPGTAPCCNRKVMIDGVYGCGCPLKKKTKCLSCECPARKWLAVMTEQQQNEIENGKNDSH